MFLREVEVMKITNEGATEGLRVCEDLAKCELLPSHRNEMQTTRILRGDEKTGNFALEKVINTIFKKYEK